MKTLLSLRKKANSPHFIGFACASCLYFALGAYLLYSPQSKNISLKQDGNHRFTLALQALHQPSTPPKQPTQAKPTPQASSRPTPPKPIAQPISPTPPQPTPQKTEPQKESTQQESSTPPKPIQTNKQDNTNTPETLMHNQGVSDQFLSQIHSLISSHNPYPRMARKQRLQGEVVVEFVLETSGEMKEVKIIQSNAKEILQRSALKALYSASKYFPLPQKRVKIRVPILYKLA